MSKPSTNNRKPRLEDFESDNEAFFHMDHDDYDNQIAERWHKRQDYKQREREKAQRISKGWHRGDMEY